MRLKPHKTRKPDALSIAIGILLCVYVIGLFAPMVWTVIISFMDPDAYYSFYQEGTAVPFTFTVENFKNAIPHIKVTSETTSLTYNMVGLYINSLKFAVFSALSFTVCSTLVSYLTARFDFKFSKIVYAFVIVAMSLPIVGSMPSEIQMLQNLGIYGQWISVPILRFNFLSVYFLVFHATFRGISKEYSEAAKIDGASNLRIMFQVVVPQAMNIIVTVFVIMFITYWNDYQVPMLYLKDYPVAAYAVYQFVNTTRNAAFNSSVPLQMAGTLLMTLPVLITVIIFNKRLRVSVSIGGIKG